MSAGPYAVITDLYSKAGIPFVLGCADDDNDGSLSPTETGYVTDRIAEVSDMFFQKLGLLYTSASLAASGYINRGVTVCSCYQLSKRRAMPPKYKDDWEYWFGVDGDPNKPGVLEKIRIGIDYIPDAQPIADPVALQSNMGYVAGQPNSRPDVVDVRTDPQAQRRQHSVRTDAYGGSGWGGLF